MPKSCATRGPAYIHHWCRAATATSRPWPGAAESWPEPRAECHRHRPHPLRCVSPRSSARRDASSPSARSRPSWSVSALVPCVKPAEPSRIEIRPFPSQFILRHILRAKQACAVRCQKMDLNGNYLQLNSLACAILLVGIQRPGETSELMNRLLQQVEFQEA